MDVLRNRKMFQYPIDDDKSVRDVSMISVH